MLEDYDMLELWTAGAAEWTAEVRHTTGLDLTACPQQAKPAPANGVMGLLIGISLFLVSIAALGWGTAQLTAGAAQGQPHWLPGQDAGNWAQLQ